MRNIAAGLILTAFSAAAVAPHADPELLLPGDEYVASELPADPTGNWFVLLARDKTYVLEELPIVIKAFHDPCIDDSPEQQSGRTVHVRFIDSAVLLVRGIDGLLPGTVESAVFPVDHHGYDFDDLLHLSWLGHQLSLRAATVNDGYRVELLDTVGAHLLFTTEWTDDGSWALRWAGDLNRDGIPDILLDATHKYSLHTTRLFLSRKNPRGHDYEETATLTTTAC